MTDIIAHRGASRAAPENTVDAFALAVAMGADGIELDVRRTRDGCLVVHHDARIASGEAIIDLDRRDLPDHIPDLRDALLACAGPSGAVEVTVNIEIKNDAGEPDFDPTRSIAPLRRTRRAGRRRSRAVADLVVRPGDGRRRAGDRCRCRDGVARRRRAGRRRQRADEPRSPGAASMGRHARSLHRRRVPRRRDRRQHLDLRRPGAHARAHRVGRRRHLHERARHRPRRPRRHLQSGLSPDRSTGNTSRTASGTWANSSRVVSPR